MFTLFFSLRGDSGEEKLVLLCTIAAKPQLKKVAGDSSLLNCSGKTRTSTAFSCFYEKFLSLKLKKGEIMILWPNAESWLQQNEGGSHPSRGGSAGFFHALFFKLNFFPEFFIPWWYVLAYFLNFLRSGTLSVFAVLFCRNWRRYSREENVQMK